MCSHASTTREQGKNSQLTALDGASPEVWDAGGGAYSGS